VGLDVGDADGRNVGDTVGEGNSGLASLSHRVGSHIGPQTPPNSSLLIRIHASSSDFDPPAPLCTQLILAPHE